MIVGIKNVIWNIRLKGWSYVKNYAGIAAVASVAWGGAWFGVYRTRKTLSSVVVGHALDRERSGAPEYLYYNDPAHEQTLLQLFQAKGWSIWPYVGKWARRWRRAVWRRLLQVARYGDPIERARALHHLKHLGHLKEWEVRWIAQRLDGPSAVQLARMGAGPRLLGAPPLPPALRSLPPRLPLMRLAQLQPHHQCLAAYLQRHGDPHQDVQQMMDSDETRSRAAPDSEEELQEALGAALHHLAGRVGGAPAAIHFAQDGGLALLRRAASSPKREMQLMSARLLLCLAPYTELLPIIHRAGLIKSLARWLESDDAELVCLAGGALVGLGGGFEHYGPAVQLLHPTHLTNTPIKLDVITVHGLLGEPFVTWRQRDINEDEKKATQIEIEAAQLEIEAEDDEERQYDHEYEFVLRDLPESAIRAPKDLILSHRGHRGFGKQELQELNERTRCWPRDWLPRDCPHIRVLGVSYDTVMTEWGAGECEAESGGGGLDKRARMLAEALRRAGVGQRPTLWAAHSMGGLLVKQMLVHSLQSEDESERALAANTWGVVFYSTPHHGTRAAHALLWPSREVQDLREDSSVLKKLHSVWLTGNWRCVCLAEGRPTRLVPGLPRMLLVPPSSADAGVGPCYTLPLNHLDICKPATRHSFIYRQVVEMVQHATGERCSPQGCSQCSSLPTKKGNFLTTLYARIFQKEMPRASAEGGPQLNRKPKKKKDDKEKKSPEDNSRDWWLGIMSF